MAAFLLSLLVPSLFPSHGLTTLCAQTAANPLVRQMIGQASKDTAMACIRKLESYGTRYELSPQRDTAATYIINTMKRWGVTNESDSYSYSQADYFDLEMVDQTNGWVIGQDTRNLKNFVFKTSDAGQTWSSQPTPNASSLLAIDFVNPRTGWIVGSGGSVFKTIDSGSTWQAQSSGTVASLLDVGFANDQLGFAVGEGGTILRTVNGGAQWTSIDGLGVASYRRCAVVNAQLAWIVGTGGTILRTNDGGITWTKQSSGVSTDLNSIDFADSLNGWVIGSKAVVLKTTDGGTTWSSVSTPSELRRSAEVNSVDLVAFNPTNVLILTANEIWKTNDGAQTWGNSVNLGTRCLRRLGSSSAATFGGFGGINRSTNSGTTWQLWDQNVPRYLYATSRNCIATLPGSITPEKEYIIVAHYDGPIGNVPGADDNGSGVAAALEVLRVLKGYKFESTIRVVFTSAQEIGLLGSRRYAAAAKSAGRDIRLVTNLDMIGYPVVGDTSRIIFDSYRGRSPYVDSVLTYKTRYGSAVRVDTYVDSVGEGDTYSFGFAGYETLHCSEGTSKEILAGNPYQSRPTDTSDKLHQGMILRTIQLIIATYAELAKPVELPQKPWAWKVPFERWNDMRAISIIDANTAVASGDFGTLIRTTNGGRTWNRLAVSTSYDLKGVSFVDPSRGVVVGDYGTILRTTNGGATWTSRSYDIFTTFYDVAFTDANTGTAVGSKGALYRTTDGGASWAPQLATPLITLYAVSYSDKNNGIIVGSSGSIFRTTDGGVKWTRQVSGLEGSYALSIFDVHMLNGTTGFAVGEAGTILCTTNGGANWTTRQSGTSLNLRGIYFLDDSKGFAVGDGGLILGTSDGGNTWVERSKGITTWFSAIRFATPSVGYTLGSDGMLMRTADGGETWSYQIGGPRVPLKAVRFTEALKGIVVGSQGSIYRTIDGGASWEGQVSGTTQELRGIDFADLRTAVAVGDSGTIVRTTDGGVTWSLQRLDPKYMLNGVAFSSPTNGLIVGWTEIRSPRGEVFPVTRILRTMDGGVNWVLVSQEWGGELYAVCYGGMSTAYAVGTKGLILSSTDGGVRWFVQAKPDPETGFVTPKATLKAVSFAGPNYGFVVGDTGTVMRTVNGGTAWSVQKPVTQSNLNGVWTVNGANILAVGDAGVVIASSDAGVSWVGQVAETSRDLYAVHFTDVDRGTIVGDRGIILRTALANVVPSAIEGRESSSVPGEYFLSQNYPNPFNSATTIEFRLAGSAMVSLKVYDLLGRELTTLMDEKKGPGLYRVRWNAGSAPSGVYFYRLVIGDGSSRVDQRYVSTKKMIMLK